MLKNTVYVDGCATLSMHLLSFLTTLSRADKLSEKQPGDFIERTKILHAVPTNQLWSWGKADHQKPVHSKILLQLFSRQACASQLQRAHRLSAGRALLTCRFWFRRSEVGPRFYTSRWCCWPKPHISKLTFPITPQRWSDTSIPFPPRTADKIISYRATIFPVSCVKHGFNSRPPSQDGWTLQIMTLFKVQRGKGVAQG